MLARTFIDVTGWMPKFSSLGLLERLEQPVRTTLRQRREEAGPFFVGRVALSAVPYLGAALVCNCKLLNMTGWSPRFSSTIVP